VQMLDYAGYIRTSLSEKFFHLTAQKNNYIFLCILKIIHVKIIKSSSEINTFGHKHQNNRKQTSSERVQ